MISRLGNKGGLKYRTSGGHIIDGGKGSCLHGLGAEDRMYSVIDLRYSIGASTCI